MIPNAINPEIEIVTESFESLSDYGNKSETGLEWNHVFTLPQWMKTWWNVFGGRNTPYLFSVRQEGRILGIAPLQIGDDAASIVGGPDVCDYLDFIVSPGTERDFFAAVLDHLVERGVNRLDLRCLRPDSAALRELVPLAQERGCRVIREPDDVSLETALPETWEGYLERLASKQRHEVKRKIRRLEEAGHVDFSVYHDSPGIHERLDIFFRLFRESRTDKSEFMTPLMESFFKGMIDAMVDSGILKLGILSLNHETAAAVLFFDYRNRIYLYNNGYDLKFSHLSAGVLSKAILIRYAIENKKEIFDFLKGTEIYKYRLGGNEVPLSRLNITLDPS
jgi:CelD/BcsL family acetyltransferase involved in cellulose biosynthesis